MAVSDSATLLIAATELRRRIRDRSILIIGIAAPLGLAFVLSLVLGPLDAAGFDVEIGLVDQDGSEISAGLERSLTGLADAGVVGLSTGLTEEEARRRIGDDLDAAIVVPAGFADVVGGGESVELTVIGDVDASLATEITRSITAGYLQRLRSTTVAVGVVGASGAVADLDDVAARAAEIPDPVVVGEVAAATRLLDSASYFTAAMAVFFVFFTVQVGVASLLDEKREGTMDRLLAAPISRSSIIAGKTAASFVLGVASMVILAVAAQTLIGADWGAGVGVALLVVAVVLAALGIMMVIAGFADTPESAANIQSIVAVTLGALGGTFFQITGEGPIAQLARLTPHHWFLGGLADLSAGADSSWGVIEVVLPAVGAILVFAVVTGSVGWVRLGRKLSQ